MWSLIPLSLALLLPAINAQNSTTNSTAACAPIHIIIARASTEAQGPGIIGSLADKLVADHPGTTTENVVYPATLADYANSSSQGTTAMKALLTSYVDACPSSKIVMMGYSQGAQVVGDVMCGGGGVTGLGNATAPVDAKYGANVKAMIQMGDPRHILNQTYDVGTANSDGLFPRQASQNCTAYADKIQVYCDDGDPFCEKGDTLAVHLNYTQKYNEQARAFVNAKLV